MKSPPPPPPHPHHYEYNACISLVLPAFLDLLDLCVCVVITIILHLFVCRCILSFVLSFFLSGSSNMSFLFHVSFVLCFCVEIIYLGHRL